MLEAVWMKEKKSSDDVDDDVDDDVKVKICGRGKLNEFTESRNKSDGEEQANEGKKLFIRIKTISRLKNSAVAACRRWLSFRSLATGFSKRETWVSEKR